MARRLYWFVFRPKTAGVKVAVERDGELLMIRNAYGKAVWTFPGGAVGRRETPDEAAVREVMEETGLCVSGLRKIGELTSRREFKRDTIHCFSATSGSQALAPDPTEITDAAWFGKNQLPQNISSVAKEILSMLENRTNKYVVVGLVSRKRGDGTDEYLLVKAKKDFGRFTGCWYPPGGHQEENEDESSALVREVREELGLTVGPLKKMAETPGDLEGQVTCWWSCALLSDEMTVDQTEIAEAGWFTKSEMKDMRLWPATRSFFQEHVFTGDE